MFKPFDRFVTRAWRVLLDPYRVARTHHTIQIPQLEADFFIESGPRLPEWTGLLGTFAQDGLLIGESETGYLTVEEIETARLKISAVARKPPKGPVGSDSIECPSTSDSESSTIGISSRPASPAAGGALVIIAEHAQSGW